MHYNTGESIFSPTTSMATIQIRIDDSTKKKTKKILDELGLDFSTAIKMFFKQIAIRKGMPFEVLTENGFTIEVEKEILRRAQEKDSIGPFDADEALELLQKKL